MPGITRKLELRIAGEASTLSAPLNLYRGDRGIDIFFRIMDFSYDFTGTNLLRNIGSARYNAIVVKPDGSNYVTPTQPIVDNEVKFTITKDLTDEMTEIGTYTLQFLLHGAGDSRIAIPPITIGVKELIADVADGADGQANYSTTNKTTIKAGETTIEARWEIGELITADKLNWTRDKAIQGAETSQANSNKISVLEPKVATLEKKVTPLQADVNTLKEKVDDFQNINVMNQEATGVENISLSDTYDGVTKDLIINGMTLKNLVRSRFNKNLITKIIKDENKLIPNIEQFENGKTYTVIYKIDEVPDGQTEQVNLNFGSGGMGPDIKLTNSTKVGVHIQRFTLTGLSSYKDKFVSLYYFNTIEGVKISDVMIFEGNLQYIPSTYFDSITSTGELEDNKIKIKSVGKNLFNSTFEIGGITGNTGLNYDSSTHCRSGFIKVPESSDITVSGLLINESMIFLYDSNKNYIGYLNKGDVSTYTISTDNVSYVRLRSRNLDNINNSLIMIEEGSVATNYEPYVADLKTIKLPFDNGLKSLPNGACDEIQNKQIIQRVGRIVLNGSENWTTQNKTSATSTLCFQFKLDNVSVSTGCESVCDKLLYIDGLWKDEPQFDKRGYDIAGKGDLVVRELKSNLSTQDVVGWKKYLQTNPVTVYYELAQPIIHPLYEDYSLRTYQGVTHLYQENNICGEMDVSVPSNRDGIIYSNTMEIVELNDKLEQTFDYLGGKIPVYVPESFEGDTTIKDSMIGETQQLSVKGRTLKNLLNNKNLEFDSVNNRLAIKNSENKSLFANKTYTLFNLSNKTIRYTIDRISNNSYIRGADVSANTISVVSLNEDEYISIIFGAVKDGWENSEDSKNQLKQSCVILEGGYNCNPFNSHFDSIASTGEQEDNKIKIKSVGKNLFEPNYFNENAEASNITRKLKYKLKPNTQYTCSSNIPKAVGKPATVYFNGGSSDTNGVFLNTPKTFTSNSLGEIDLLIRVNGESGFTIQDFINGDMWIQLEENSIATNYEDYVEDIKEIKIPFEGGLKELDTIEGNSIIQRIDMKKLNGTEEWFKHSEMTNTILFYTPCEKNISYGMCDKFKAMPKSTIDEELYYYGDRQFIFIRILKSRLSSLDATGFKRWLQENNTTVFYNLKEPIVHKINEDINLSTFDETTHITQENNIVANMKMLVPVSLNKSIGRVQDENDSLTKENRILKEDNKIVAEALLNILQPISTLDEKGVKYKSHSQEEIINKLIEILNR